MVMINPCTAQRTALSPGTAEETHLHMAPGVQSWGT